MSFFKKLLGTYDKTPEEIAEEEHKKEEKKLIAEKSKKRAEENRQKDLAIQVKYIGKGFGKNFTYSLYKPSIQYFESFILNDDEDVICSIPAEYDKTKKREIKGLLIATNLRLVFVTNGVGHGQFFEEFDYRKINGISHMADGFSQRELLIDYGRSRKVFDDIIYDNRFKEFLNTVQKMMHCNHGSTIKQIRSSRPTNQTSNPYEELEKLASLRDKGILTEEEFQQEKQKILSK